MYVYMCIHVHIYIYIYIDATLRQSEKQLCHKTATNGLAVPTEKGQPAIIEGNERLHQYVSKRPGLEIACV